MKISLKLINFLIFKFIILGFVSAQTSVKYVKPNNPYPEKTEWIILYSDSTFEYYFRIPFVTQSIKGKFTICNDTLKLNSRGEKMIISEDYLPKLPKKIKRFDVAYFAGNELNYQIILKKVSKELLLTNKYGIVDIKFNNLIGFNISSLIEYPYYRLKNKKSNYFKIRLNPERVFKEEKWLINGKKIRPLGYDGKFLEYYLIQE